MRYSSVDQLVVAYCSDLSKGGMFLATDRFLPVNAVVQVNLGLPDDAGDIPIICRVAFVRDSASAAASHKPPGMGLEFLDVSLDCLSLIEAFISERITSDAEKIDPQPAIKRLSLLIVDDDVSCQKLASAPFRARGDYVRIAPDGFEALAMCLKEPPDLILSDVNMPRMDGWQLLRMIRTRPSLASIPVIFTTTLSGEAERLRGYQLGVDDYVPKPYHSIELRARVDRLAARVQQQTRTLIERKTLRGDLAQVALPSVLAFLEMEQKTGELLVVSTQTARLHLRAGRPLRIEIDDAPAFLTSQELMFLLLGWETGQFEFAAQDVACPDEVQSTVTALLLEYARQKDEAAR